jgi:hypothetical protein
VVIDKVLIAEMDKHIITQIRQHMANGTIYKPAIGYANFCEEHELRVQAEQTRLLALMDKAVTGEKIKKAYKNRYFTLLQ